MTDSRMQDHIADCVQAQREYCERENLPNFTPDGQCFSCGRNVYERYTIVDASSRLTTGCPFCCKSFCE